LSGLHLRNFRGGRGPGEMIILDCGDETRQERAAFREC